MELNQHCLVGWAKKNGYVQIANVKYNSPGTGKQCSQLTIDQLAGFRLNKIL